MVSESITWSAPCALFNTKDHLDVGGKPGVYRIRAFTDRNEPMKIQRVNGVDSLGVLHIGKSKNLGLRIRTFRQAAEGLKAAHHAGCEFHGGVLKTLSHAIDCVTITPSLVLSKKH